MKFMEELLRTVRVVKKKYNPQLEIEGILYNKVESRFFMFVNLKLTRIIFNLVL